MSVVDRALYLNVLHSVEPMSVLPDGEVMMDRLLFDCACQAAIDAVPLTLKSLGGRFRNAEIGVRLREALEYRDRWYRSHLTRTQ